MNIKTTIGLAIAVIVVSSAYLLWSRQQISDLQREGDIPLDDETISTVQRPEEPEDEDRRLTQPPLADDTRIVQVVYQRRGRPQMLFERIDQEDEGAGEWMMIEPTRCTATGYMVRDIVLAVKGLKYASKYELEGADALSLEQAGIRPEPRARFAVTSHDGQTVEVQVGHPLIAQNNTYAHLPSRSDELFVVQQDFSSIVDREVTEFRERNMFTLTPLHAVELQVIENQDGRSTEYTLRKQPGRQWAFVSPFKAQAERKQIDDVVSAMGRLWARTWIERVPDNLAGFGLDPAYLEIRVRTEQVVEPEPPPAAEAPEGDAGEEDAEEAEPEVRRDEFVLLLSDRHPIDDREQVYAKRGEDEQVGTINAAELEKFIPRLTEWRNMDLLEPSAASANALTIERAEGTLKFELRGDAWYFADTDQPAEPAEVRAVLDALDSLHAVSFVDDGSPDEMGLDPPLAEVTLGFPDFPESEIIRIGGFTEPVEKLLRYVQRVGSTAVAKVRARQIEPLFTSAQAFRGREILNVPEPRVIRIELSRWLPALGEKQFLTLARDPNRVWQMIAPVQSAVNLQPLNDLAASLAGLRGLRIVDELNPDNLGLADPQIQVAVTVEGVPVLREGAEAAAGEPWIRQISFSKIDDRVYAHRLDVPAFMEVEPSIYDQLMAEFLDRKIWDFDAAQVVAFGSTTEGRTVELRKDRGRWRCSLEPDIPIDPQKVEEHIQQFRQVETSRFVEYSAGSASAFGLDEPTHRLFLELDSGVRREMLVSGIPYRATGERYYATIAGTNRVFVITPAILDLGILRLERFEADG